MISDDQRMRLFDQHKHKLKGIVRRYSKQGRVDPDLLAVSRLALWISTEKYDPAHRDGAKFWTYALIRVIGAIKQDLRDYSRMIRLPAWVTESSPESEIVVILSGEALETNESPPPVDHVVDGTLAGLLRSAVPPDCRQGLAWLILRAETGYTWAELADHVGTKLSIVLRKVREAREGLRASPQVRRWAGIEE
jgi:DNA-directed RNA polymerase specialized sigma24 family protein